MREFMNAYTRFFIFGFFFVIPAMHAMEVDDDNDIKPELLFQYDSLVTTFVHENNDIIVTGHENGKVYARKTADPPSSLHHTGANVHALCSAGTQTHTNNY